MYSRLAKPWPNDYTFLSTFAIHLFVLQKSSDVLCCGQTVRHFTIQFIRISNLEACFHRRFSPSQQQPVQQHKRVQSFIIRWNAIEENNCTGRFIRARVLFHESEQRAKAGKGYFENVSTQVDIENAGGPIMRTRPHTRP